MTDQSPSDTPMTGPTDEVYSQRDNPAFEAVLAARSASDEVAFFLVHLRSGMRVLDVGSGPGAITMGLAEAAAPAEARQHAAFFRAQLAGMARTAIAEEWLNQSTIDGIANEADTWAERPGAFSARI